MEKYLLTILGSSVDYYLDSDTYPEEGDFSHSRYCGSYAGGCPLNVGAVCASKHLPVKALDLLGSKDPTTPFLLSKMQEFGIDTEPIRFDETTSNGKVVIIITGDKRTMHVIDPIRPYYQVDQAMQDLMNDATYIYSLMHMINRSFDSIDYLKIAKQHGVRIILDGSSKYDDPSRARILYELADGLFINTTDYERLKQVSDGEPYEIILNHGGEFVAVTDGAKGTHLYTKNGQFFTESLSDISVIDSTGAGDAFAGCFLACLLSGYDYEKALKLASVHGAYACTVFGAQGGMASFEELLRFAKEHDYAI